MTSLFGKRFDPRPHKVYIRTNTSSGSATNGYNYADGLYVYFIIYNLDTKAEYFSEKYSALVSRLQKCIVSTIKLKTPKTLATI